MSMKKFKDMDDLAEVARAVERNVQKEKRSAAKKKKKRSLDAAHQPTRKTRKCKVAQSLLAGNM